MSGGRRFNLDDYIPVQERINDFWKEHQDGCIVTTLMSLPDDFKTCRYKAEVYRTASDTRPAATGWAFENAGGQGANSTSHEENCETSAIGRALANLGYATSLKDRPSREEMRKAKRGESRQPTPTRTADDDKDYDEKFDKFRARLGMLYGATKDLGHVVMDSQGHLHHDEQWLTNEAAQRFNLGGNPNFSGSEDLTDAQIDELITEFRSRQKARLNKPVELHPGISPSKQVPPISDWTAFWRFANANGYTKEKVQGLNGGSLPAKVKDAVDLIVADMEQRPHLTTNNQVS